MSTNASVYVPKSSAKERTTSFGQIINLSFNAKELIDFVNANTNEKGYINLEVVPRKEVSSYGDTHSVKLNNWKPEKTEGATPARQPQKPAPRKPAPAAEQPNDDVPF